MQIESNRRSWAVTLAFAVLVVALAVFLIQRDEPPKTTSHVPAAMQERLEAASRLAILNRLVVASKAREPQVDGTITATKLVQGKVTEVKETKSYSLPSSSATGDQESSSPETAEAPDWRTHAMTVVVDKCLRPRDCTLEQAVVGISTGPNITAADLQAYFAGKSAILFLEPATAVFADSPEIEYSIPLDGELVGIVDGERITYPFATSDSKPALSRIAATRNSLANLK